MNKAQLKAMRARFSSNDMIATRQILDYLEANTCLCLEGKKLICKKILSS